MLSTLALASKGLVLGIIVVLPGMSGGTLLLILGMYKKLLADLSRLRILPYIPFVVGAAGGIYISGMTMTYLFLAYRNLASALLLGSVLASIRAVLGNNPAPNLTRVLIGLLGVVVGYLMAGEPMGLIAGAPETGALLLVLGGAIASATMLVPGIPGSSVLIVLGIYDNVLRYLAELNFVRLGFFALGSLVGIFALANVLDKLYSRHRLAIGWFFSGLIVGSVKMLLPTAPFNLLPLVAAFAIGFALVWVWCDYRAERA